MKKLPEGEKRRRATLATLEKYRGRAFDWEGGVTCVHMLRFHLRRLGVKAPRVPKLRSAAEAKAALREHGWRSVAEMLDGLGLQRIAPAQMRLGDIAVLAGDEALGAVTIWTGGMVIGWHEDQPEMAVMDPLAMEAAWSALPRVRLKPQAERQQLKRKHKRRG